jgi:hypothetical protein
MNSEIPKNNSTDEVDLGHIFNAIGKLFERLFNLIGSIFKGVFSFFISFLRIIIENFVVIGVVVSVAFIIGFITEQYKKPVYEANMLVKPYFDSKYQLISSINYFNTLLDDGRHEVLADIFKITDVEAEALKEFEVETGPETKNELLKQYDVYLKSLDSARAKSVTYTDFVENRDIYSSELFLITVKSFQGDIFRKLEGSFDSIFSNSYSIEQKIKRDRILEIKQKTFEKDLESMDSLQSLYANVIRKEAERGTASMSVQGLLPLQQEKAQTKEFDVLIIGMRTRDSIKVLEELKVEENTYVQFLSRFPEVGKKQSKLVSKHWVIFPVFAFAGLCILYLMFSTFKFIKNHD